MSLFNNLYFLIPHQEPEENAWVSEPDVTETHTNLCLILRNLKKQPANFRVVLHNFNLPGFLIHYRLEVTREIKLDWMELTGMGGVWRNCDTKSRQRAHWAATKREASLKRQLSWRQVAQKYKPTHLRRSWVSDYRSILWDTCKGPPDAQETNPNSQVLSLFLKK